MKTALTFVAGFCDTATFIHMNGVFSAHVTGNFVLFASALTRGIEPEDYLKIFTFPVFIIAVVIGTLLYHSYYRKKGEHCYQILLWTMTITLVIASITAIAVASVNGSYELQWFDIAVTLTIVFAIAIQNTIHHFVPGPMTTVMTGTVMNTSATLTERFLLKKEIKPSGHSIQPSWSTLWMITSFAVGCLLGAYLVLQFGLSCIMLPAVLMLFLMLRSKGEH